MPIIVWDRDDVLVDLMRCWLDDWWNPANPGCQVSYDDLEENPPHKIIGVSLEEYLKSLDEFRVSDRAASVQPVPEVLEWFGKFGHCCRHMVLSATSLETAPAAASWTFRHFGAWIRSFHLIPSPRHGESISHYETDKGEYIHWLGMGDVLVDDSPANIESVARYGVAGVLMPRPWNGKNGEITDALDRLTAIVDALG